MFRKSIKWHHLTLYTMQPPCTMQRATFSHQNLKNFFNAGYNLMLQIDSLAPGNIFKKFKHGSIIGRSDIYWSPHLLFHQVHTSVDISTHVMSACQSFKERMPSVTNMLYISTEPPPLCSPYHPLSIELYSTSLGPLSHKLPCLAMLFILWLCCTSRSAVSWDIDSLTE